MYHVQTLVGNTAELSPDRFCPNCGAISTRLNPTAERAGAVTSGTVDGYYSA